MKLAEAFGRLAHAAKDTGGAIRARIAERMVLFIVTPGYRHNFRPRRANDSMPVQPLVDTLLYWLCTAFGGLFGSIGLVALLANLIEDVTFERVELIVIGVM